MANTWFGVAWLFMGLMWLRRAYTGERPGILVTLNPSADLKLTKSERMMRLSLGIANLLLGVASLWLGLRHAR